MSAGQGIIIAGAAETNQLGKLPGISTLGLHIEGALNAVAIIGAAMLVVGLASIGSALRHRVPPVPGPVDTSLQPEPSPR